VANVTAGGFIGSRCGREQPDLSPDFVVSYRTRVTIGDYEVEVAHSFKSIRYQPRGSRRNWRLNIVRQEALGLRLGLPGPARRAARRFLGQSGIW